MSNKSISFSKYRIIDLSILAALLLVSEAVTTVATNRWFDAQAVAITTTLLFVCIGMMRWSYFGAIYSVLGGIVFCIASGASVPQLIIYGVGNLGALIAMIWFIPFGKEGVRADGFKLVLFVITAYLGMQGGRWIVSLCFGGGLAELVGFLLSDLISLLFTAVIMMLLKSVDGMIEDQKSYLFRLQRQREDEARAEQMQYMGYGDED